MKFIFILGLIQISIFSCSDKGSKSEKNRRKKKRSTSINSKVPMMGEKSNIKIPEQFKNMKINFPKTICGRITKRIMECETQRIKLKYKDRQAYAKSKATYIRIKFSTKLPKYLEVCRGVAGKLPTEKLDKCLSFECEKMDLCMKKLTKQK
jgi:hypothetical protein